MVSRIGVTIVSNNIDYTDLKERYDEAYAFKGRWLALYNQLYMYVIPNRDAFNVRYNYQDDGKPTTNTIWDSTAMTGAYQRALDLHGLLFPHERIWGKFNLNPHLFSQAIIDQTKSKMDEINKTIFHYINDSNLSRVVSASLLDLVGGTAALWVESIDDEQPLNFRSIPAIALYIEYSNDDMVNTCWFDCKMNGLSVMRNFTEYKGKQYQALKDCPYELYTVIYGQIKRDDGSFHIYAVLEGDKENPLFEVNRSYNQVIIIRDRIRPGEAEGRGIGLDMLPTIMDLNKTVEYDRKALSFKAFPPMFYDSDSYFNPSQMRQWSGAMLPRNPSRERNPIDVMQFPDNPDVMERVQYLTDKIEKAFMIQPIGDMGDSTKSATEISIRENRAQRTSSTDMSRLINDGPKQIYEVAAKILGERKLLTKDRDPRININTKKFAFEFVSPLYDLQAQQDLQNLVSSFQIKQQFFGEAAVMGSVDVGEINSYINDKLNIPYKLSKTAQQIDQFIQAYAQAQQQAAGPTPATAPITPGQQNPAVNAGVQV